MSTREWPGSGGHRWSGWPGAYCLDCGAESVIEFCVTSGCPGAWKDCGCAGGCDRCCGMGVVAADCPDHREAPCSAAQEG